MHVEFPHETRRLNLLLRRLTPSTDREDAARMIRARHNERARNYRRQAEALLEKAEAAEARADRAWGWALKEGERK